MNSRKNFQKTIVIFISIVLLLSVGLFCFNKQKKFEGIHLSPNEYMFLQRSYPYGKLKEGNLEEVLNWKQKDKYLSRIDPISWELVGPTNVGGRITDIEIPNNFPLTYYVATATGGIFKTDDAGISWDPIFDDQNILSIGDIEISKTNNDIVVVGTGEVNGGGGSTTYDGNGVYKSIDGGLTWESKGLTNVGSIAKVIINAVNPNIIYVGAMGSLYNQNENRGIYKSIDGGNTWSKILFVTDHTGVIDMVSHPTNSNILYAATWERTRTPENRIYSGITSNIYKSIDAGLNWIILENGLPSTSDKGRISIDIANDNPNILYATYTNNLGTSNELFKTIDAGNNWTTISTNGITNSAYYNWWFGGVFINPTNSNNVYIAGFDANYSLDSGNTWNVINDMHVDQHAIAFNSNNETLIGNDGGLYRSTDGIFFSKINNLPISQVYRINVDRTNSAHVYAGFQDNNTQRTLTGQVGDWLPIFGGDGFQTQINPDNSAIIFAEYQYGQIFKSSNFAASFNFTMSGISEADPKNWDTPYIYDPNNNNNVMYYGSNRLYKSIDEGVNWTPISQNLSKSIYTGTQKYGTITTIDVSPLNSNIIYVGTDDGNVWKTENGGVNWIKISNTLPNKWVTKVKASPNSMNTVYVTYSGYRYGQYDGHLYRSSDTGTTWEDLSANIPNVPVSDIEVNANNVLFLGTDIGVVVSYDNGMQWNLLGINMPNVIVSDLHIHKATNFLYAGTFGRGVYKIDLDQLGLSTTSSQINFNSVKVYPNPASEYIFVDLVLNQTTNFNAAIFDANGKKVQSYKTDKKSTGRHLIKMDVSFLQKGTYFILINDSKESKKIVIRAC